ncbi:type II toxin-antitoxin system RelE/ParE family toxin [Devosia sp. SL43]|uniref:type II toxin-antitoxin system RelE/ParE family toxin n=1 Tax=Devosia sp. SL43 TaxID=2806348 RepID=UPI001F2332C3|nr:type II toxin-antitoxin system RelE/ParE family toxin [Devosia sp. SL43]UJW87359.1 type II toxin-antitoxin system RelE/ParE family toxin [Devosia sp. SL43]
MAWRFVDDAAVDMQHVAEDGILNFGDNHARMYTLKVVEMFDQLAAMPYLARERQAANSLVRLMTCGSQNILYIVENEDVIVLRVLHGLQNWFELL